MQPPRRTNRDRTATTRAALMQAARRLFIDKGYGETSTPEIVTAAGITRGALYHHFEDKKALFRAVVTEEAEAVADEIERSAAPTTTALDALIAGSDAYLTAMRVPGRTRLLLLEGPSVLGLVEMKELDEETSARTLKDGLQAAIRGHKLALPLAALADLLSATFDRAALAIDSGEDPAAYRAGITLLIRRLVEVEV